MATWAVAGVVFALLVAGIAWLAVRLRRASSDAARGRATEDALRETERRLQRILAATGTAAWEFDLQTGETRWAGPLLAMNGVVGDRDVGLERWLDELVHPDDRQAVQEAIGRVEVGEGYSVEYRALWPDGSAHWLEVQGTSVPGDDGKPRYLVGMTRDIEERQSAEAERAELERRLVEAQKMDAIGRLAGGIAHDFNNLLTAISGYIDLARERVDLEDELRSDLDEIAAAARRAATLTAKLLAFGRRQLLTPSVVDVNCVIVDLDGLLRRLLGEDVNVTVRFEDEFTPVLIDRSQLEQVIVNLAVNARDAMPDGGPLEISTRVLHQPSHGSSSVELRVSDGGVGMDAETTARALEPFFTTKEAGTGLGLSTVYGIVAQAGGQAAIESEPGRGTAVTVLLPWSATPVEAGEDGERDASVHGGAEIVLVVEDDPLVRDLVSRVLSAKGYSVEQAATAEEALDRCARVDLLVTDVILPGMSGRELAALLRDAAPALPVLFISGYAGDAIERGLTLDGTTGFLQKPFPPEVLARTVRAILDGEPVPVP